MGAALDNVMLFERQKRVAETLQRSLLPARLPDIPGLEIAARYLPATEGIDVGGDFFDIVQADDDHWSLVIGDVSGKGVAASLLMSRLHAIPGVESVAYLLKPLAPGALAQSSTFSRPEAEPSLSGSFAV